MGAEVGILTASVVLVLAALVATTFDGAAWETGGFVAEQSADVRVEEPGEAPADEGAREPPGPGTRRPGHPFPAPRSRSSS